MPAELTRMSSPPSVGDALRDHLARHARARDVGAEARRSGGRRPSTSCRGLTVVVGEADHEHVRAGAGEGDGERLPEPGVAAGHQRPPARQREGVEGEVSDVHQREA